MWILLWYKSCGKQKELPCAILTVSLSQIIFYYIVNHSSIYMYACKEPLDNKNQFHINWYIFWFSQDSIPLESTDWNQWLWKNLYIHKQMGSCKTSHPRYWIYQEYHICTNKGRDFYSKIIFQSSKMIQFCQI